MLGPEARSFASLKQSFGLFESRLSPQDYFCPTTAPRIDLAT